MKRADRRPPSGLMCLALPPNLWQRVRERWPHLRLWASIAGLLMLYQANELLWATQLPKLARFMRSMGGELTGWRKWMFAACEFFQNYWLITVVAVTACAGLHLWLFLHGSLRQRKLAWCGIVVLSALLLFGIWFHRMGLRSGVLKYSASLTLAAAR